jgi:hypothetical protein
MPGSYFSAVYENLRASIASERPVYGPDGKGGGVKIGYWKPPADINTICSASTVPPVMLYKDAPLSAPSLWYTKDDSGNLIFLDLYCKSKTGVIPKWSGNKTLVPTTPSRRAAAADPIGTAITDAAKDIPWYVWAGAGGLILLSVLRK